MKPLSVGLVGAGVFGGYHAGKIAGSDRAAFAGVFDPDARRASELAEKHGVRSYSDAGALFAASDAVIVPCPAVYHEAMVDAALQSGCHVLVEKPLALTGEGALRLADLAEEKHLVLQVGHQERLVLAAMGFLDIPEKPLSVEAAREGPPDPNGRATDVSVVWDLMIHDLDMVAMLMGKASSVAGNGKRHHTQHLDEASAVLDFAGERSAAISASRAAAARRREMKVTFPSGYIAIDFITRKVENTTAHPIRLDVSDVLPDPLGAADEAFFAACLGERETPIPGREAAEACRLAERVEMTALEKIGA